MTKRPKVKSIDLWNCTDEEISTVTFNGEPSCRIGYQYLSASILYALSDLQLEGDPYELPGFDGEGHRILSEMAFLMGLEEDADTVVEMMKHETKGVGKLKSDELYGEVKILRDFYQSVKGKIDYNGIVEALMFKHLLLGDKLFCGSSAGLYDVLELLVMNICTHAVNSKIPLLPAPRESVVFPLKHREVIMDFMESFYTETFKYNVGLVEFVTET